MAANTTDETHHHRLHHHNNNNNNNSIKDLLSGWGTGRPCNICQIAVSLIYCNTDAAFFCGPCDAKIHPPTPTHFPRHERVWVCEVCEQRPSVFACKADDANLCSDCDHDIHHVNPLARRHDRVPVIPFYDSPIDAAAARSSSVSAVSSAFLVPENLDSPTAVSAETGAADDDADTWLIPNPNSTFLYNDSNILNYNNNYGCPKFVTNSPQFQRQDDAKPATILEDDNNNRNYSFAADSVVPSQSQGNSNNFNNNNFAVNSNQNFVNSNSLFDNCFNIDFTQPNKLQKKNNNDSPLLSPSFNYSVSSSEIGVVPDGSASSMSSEISYSFGKSAAGDGGSYGGAPVMDREARVLRYREKRKNRKFEKTIRYASRKAYAETRPRVKGRFAKRTDSSETSEVDFAGDNGGYGVVPAF